MSECPGCYARIDDDRPAVSLAHAVFCAPPGIVDLTLWHLGGTITPTLARWVGNSIARMAGAPPIVGRTQAIAMDRNPQGVSNP